MNWLNSIVDDVEAKYPSGEIIVSSGASPSGTYHVGHLREIIISDAVVRLLKAKNRQARHIHFVDDLDGLRKVPVNVPASYEEYLGVPLCDVPAPDGSDRSYGEFFVDDFLATAKKLGIEMEVEFSNKKYREGFFVPAIETALDNIKRAKKTLEQVSGRELGKDWSPIQVNEDGYLKKREFLKINTKTKTIKYRDKDGAKQEISYASGDVKLDWRLDWPARWALVGVNVEAFGRDHATKGGSYDTGKEIVEKVYKSQAPIPIPYDFVNRTGDTKKMSASKGTGVDASEVVEVLPPEIVRFFMLRYAPDKRLYFDTGEGAMRLFDEFAELLASNPNDPLLQMSQVDQKHLTISQVPFSHLVASYQAALKNPDKTIEVLARTEYAEMVGQNTAILKDELKYIDQWLNKWAPDDIKFDLVQTVSASSFNDKEKSFLGALAAKVASAPTDANGEWFHKAIYDLKDESGLEPKQMFVTLYRALIGKEAGPRAGWFLSILPRDWLIKRLRLES